VFLALAAWIKVATWSARVTKDLDPECPGWVSRAIGAAMNKDEEAIVGEA
jgi:hypothetical protein